MRPIELTYIISGERYFTVKHFAQVTMRSEINVRVLIWRGNRIRKLKCMHFDKKVFVPYSELTEFPFTLPGQNKAVYHYTEDGAPTPETVPQGA